MYCVKCDYVEMYVTVHDCEGPNVALYGCSGLCETIQSCIRLCLAK